MNKINIKEIINYEIVKKGKSTLQKKAFKALIAFLLLMVLCTLLSRFADSLTIPVVTIESAKSKTMVDEITAEGRIVKNREDKISIVEGLKVDYVNVYEGTTIELGEVIVELNLDDIQSKVDEINKNISNDEKTLNRAIEDYNRAINDKKESVTKALNDMNAAKKALDDYKASAEKDEIVEQEMLSDYEMKKGLYNSALEDSNDTLDLDRNLQDIKDSLHIDDYMEELEKLQPLLDAKGKVTSPKAGIVTSVFVESGGVTGDAVISLANTENGYKFVGQLSKDKRSTIKQGQSVILSLNNGSEIIEKLTVESVAKSSENPEMLDIVVMVPAGIGNIDDIGEIIISSKAKKYSTCVPLNALRQGENSSYYILVVTEKETVLGSEKIAKKMEVRVEKKDGEFAALSEGTISRNEKIIVTSNKNIEADDRVRLEKE